MIPERGCAAQVEGFFKACGKKRARGPLCKKHAAEASVRSIPVAPQGSVPWRYGLLDRLLMRVFKHRVIENSCGEPYLIRYFVLGSSHSRSRLFDGAVYLHHIIRSDEDRALHDHPWKFTSLILWGGYVEVLPHMRGYEKTYREVAYKAPAIVKHEAADSHRLILEEPAWTLVFRGPKVRGLGFHADGRWVPWAEYTTSEDYLARKGKPPC